jgi:hypothetical protein
MGKYCTMGEIFNDSRRTPKNRFTTRHLGNYRKGETIPRTNKTVKFR